MYCILKSAGLNARIHVRSLVTHVFSIYYVLDGLPKGKTVIQIT